MTVERIENEEGITLIPDGWLDTLGAQDLGEALDRIQDTKALILDFSKVEYIASAGLRQVVLCSKKARENGWHFSVIHAGTEVMSIFQLTSLDKKISITGP